MDSDCSKSKKLIHIFFTVSAALWRSSCYPPADLRPYADNFRVNKTLRMINCRRQANNPINSNWFHFRFLQVACNYISNQRCMGQKVIRICAFDCISKLPKSTIDDEVASVWSIFDGMVLNIKAFFYCSIYWVLVFRGVIGSGFWVSWARLNRVLVCKCMTSNPTLLKIGLSGPIGPGLNANRVGR